jgi:hypothetical protein
MSSALTLVTSQKDIEAKIRKDYPDFSIYSETEVSTPVSETSADSAVAARGVLEARHVS